MAKVVLNTALSSISGTVDGYVYRTCNGKTTLMKKPTFPHRRFTTPQLQWQSRMREASAYAKAVRADPEKRAFYEALRQQRKAWRAHSLATGDYMNAPEIRGIEVKRDGAGAEIIVDAIDDVGIVELAVQVVSARGKVLLRTTAKNSGANFWRCTFAELPGQAAKIEAVAIDRPGNRTTRVVPLASANK